MEKRDMHRTPYCSTISCCLPRPNDMLEPRRMRPRASTLPVWLLVLTVIYVALISLPVPPKSYGTGLDASWMLGLNLAHARGMVAGRDVIFTYGPLGYLLYPEPVSGTPTLALIFRLGLYLLSIAALGRLVWIMQSKAAAFWTALILGLGVLLDPMPEENRVTLTIVALALLPLADRSDWRYAELSLLGLLTGLGCLVKLNQGVEGVALFIALLATVAFQDRPLTRRARGQLLAALCILPLSIVILFLASTGSLSGLAAYLRTGWEIVSGYSEAMGLPGPLWQVTLACATIAATFLVLLVAADLRSLWPGAAPALIVAFFVFKHAMVRQPGHAAPFHIRFAVGLLFLLVCVRAARDRRLIVVMQLFSVVMACAISMETYTWFEPGIKARLQLRETYTLLAAYWRWPSTWARVGARNELNRSKLRLPDRVHRVIGNATVDAIPWDVDVVEANGWNWRPRPVFQSYSAYTPALDRLDAEHLESKRAADFVILNFAAIDNRHPFLETPLSWRALLDRYDLKLATADWFLLQHRNAPRYAPLAPPGFSVARWDEDVLVPQADGMLVMGPRLRSSLSGRVASFLFRSAAVYAEVTYRSGQKLRWRCVPRNLAEGFLIRPFPQDLQDLRPLFSRDVVRNSTEQILSIRFHADKPGEFAADIPIDWSRLTMRSAETSDSVRRPFPKASLTPLWLPQDRPPQPTNAQLQARRNWIEITPATNDPQLLFSIGTTLGQFRTMVVRAWFQKADRIDAFFGKQVDGRGIYGIVPVANQWLDVYLNVSQNLFWEDEHGTMLRFDPVSSVGPGTAAYIAGIWGSTQAAPPAAPDVEFYPVPNAEAPPDPGKTP
jgi:hypothetical protein